MSASNAESFDRSLDLDGAVIEALQIQPYRGTCMNPVPSVPTICRFYETLGVYGPAIKTLIHEDFGDGNISEINFNLTVKRRPHERGDRVFVTFDGKFLAYQHNA